jgi:hypothetical protein
LSLGVIAGNFPYSDTVANPSFHKGTLKCSQNAQLSYWLHGQSLYEIVIDR